MPSLSIANSDSVSPGRMTFWNKGTSQCQGKSLRHAWNYHAAAGMYITLMIPGEFHKVMKFRDSEDDMCYAPLLEQERRYRAEGAGL